MRINIAAGHAKPVEGQRRHAGTGKPPAEVEALGRREVPYSKLVINGSTQNSAVHHAARRHVGAVAQELEARFAVQATVAEANGVEAQSVVRGRAEHGAEMGHQAHAVHEFCVPMQICELAAFGRPGKGAGRIQLFIKA